MNASVLAATDHDGCAGSESFHQHEIPRRGYNHW
jgi:hypothetical protein